MSWETVKLGELVKILSGYAFDASLFNDKFGLPLIRIRDVKRGFTNTYFNGLFHEKFIIKNGDILIGMDGEFNLSPWRSEPALLNQRVCKIESNNELKLLNSYLLHFLPIQLKKIEEKTSYVTVKHLSVKDINNIQIPLPDITIQKNIATILDKADDLRKKDLKLLQHYDALAQSLFIEMFGDPVKNEKGIVFSQVIKINPSKSEKTVENNELVSFIPMANVGEKGEFNNSLYKTFGEVKTGFTYFADGDVLFAKITPCMENGKGAIAKNLINGIGFGSTEFHVFRPNESVTSEYIYHLLALPSIRKYAELNMTGSAGQKRVSTSFFNKIKIDLPAISVQNQFASLIQNIELQKEKVKAQIQASENLFQSLLQKAFNQEL